MKKMVLYSIALASYSSICFAASTTTKQIQGQSIQFNCIPQIDTIISQVPLIITSSTMDLTNACNTLTDAAQVYEDSADQSSNLQVQGDFYYNAAQAYLTACNLVLITTENIGAIGDVQDITYIQSYRCSALQAFNQSFEAYLALCLQNANSSNTASIAANAILSLSDFLVNLINLNKQQLHILATLDQASPDFASFMQSYQPNSSCNQNSWYPVQLPGEDTANCQWKKLNLPANPTDYSGFLSPLNNSTYPVRSYFGFDPNTSTIIMQTLGTPGQIILNESPTQDGPKNHAQGLLSSPTQGSYVSNGSAGSAQNPLYDMGGDNSPSLGNILLSYSQILDPYSPVDPKADSNNPAYDENFANLIDIISQPQYIYTTPAPTNVQNLHDAVRDYMYSADINIMDSYAYNAYTNITAKSMYPADVLPALNKMNNARMNAIECYEGALLKIVTGLTGKTSIAPTIWSNLTGKDQTNALTAAKCIAIILPMYNAIFQQIKDYDLPLLSALSSQASSTSTSGALLQTANPIVTPLDALLQNAIHAETISYQKVNPLLLANVSQLDLLGQQAQHAVDLMSNLISAGKQMIQYITENIIGRLFDDPVFMGFQIQLDSIAAQVNPQNLTQSINSGIAGYINPVHQSLDVYQKQILNQSDLKQNISNAIVAIHNTNGIQGYINTVMLPIQKTLNTTVTNYQQFISTSLPSFIKWAQNNIWNLNPNLIASVSSNLENVLNATDSDPICKQDFSSLGQSATTNAQQLIDELNDAIAATDKAAANKAAADQAAINKTTAAIAKTQTTAQEAESIQSANQQTAMQNALNQIYAADKAAADKAAADKAAADKAAADKAAADKAAADKAAADKAAADKAAADKAAADKAAADKAAADKAAADKAAADKAAADKAAADKAAADKAAADKAAADKAAADKAAADKAAADKAAADKAAADKAAADKAAADKAAADKAAADKAAADKAAADKAAADKAAADKAAADKAAADKQSVKKTVAQKAPKPEAQPSVHNIIAELYEQYEEKALKHQ